MVPLTLALLSAPLWAQGAEPATVSPTAGSVSFCLYEVPAGSGVTRWANLAIVQYVDLTKDHLRLVFGGGNFGGGYEADIPIKNREEGLSQLRKVQAAAQECRAR
jgi:hypothetical protein